MAQLFLLWATLLVFSIYDSTQDTDTKLDVTKQVCEFSFFKYAVQYCNLILIKIVETIFVLIKGQYDY